MGGAAPSERARRIRAPWVGALVAGICLSVGCNPGCDANTGGSHGTAAKGEPCHTGADCQNGLDCCNGSCDDISSSVANCLGCGNACPSGETCEWYQNIGCACGYYMDRDKITPHFSQCPADQLCCRGSCKSPDPQNCGACGKTCPDGTSCCPTTNGDGTVACVAPGENGYCGACGNGMCLPLDECCGGNCATTVTSCGQCGHVCPPGQTCQQGTNGSTCVDVEIDAGGDAADAGDPCANVTCSGKTCCAVGGTPECVDLGTDVVNCGQCGKVCLGGTTCIGGNCVCLAIGVTCSAGDACCAGATCGAINGQPGTACCLPRQAPCGAGGCCGVTAGSAIPGSAYCTSGTCCQYAHAICGADTDCCAGTPGGKCSTNYYGVNLPFGECCMGSQDTCGNNNDCCDGACNGGKCCEITTCRPGSNDCCAPGICQSNGTCCLPAGSGCLGFINGMGCCPGSGCNVTTGKCQ